ncbi:flagellar biosynthetic protein FliR [Enterobacter sp.]|uniref:flagellar biosynthetic protein FliR n=1 Tax=Enterobacter sp. TaxID=42895 RepID=UPI00296FF4BD|nr:flagellar biosynthetic protein FliR [Enterobacter sp.]
MALRDINQFINLVWALWYPFVRIMAFFQFSPVFDSKALSIRLRIILSFGIALLLAPLIHAPVPQGLLTLSTIVLTLEQVLWGFLFGLMLQFVFQALQIAGQILSFNMGMSMAVMNDPNSGASTTVLSEFIYIYAAILFFAMDGHLLLVSILFKSFTYWPIGSALSAQTLRSVSLALSWTFASATLLALPTTFIMLVVQGGFGLLNRVSPALNLYSLGFPVNMLAGMVCFAALLYVLPDHFLHLANFVLSQFDALRTGHG